MACLCYFLGFGSSSRVHLKAVICYRFLLTMTFVRTHILMSPKPAKDNMVFFSKNLHQTSHNLFTESGLFALSWTEPGQGTGFADCRSLTLPLWATWSITGAKSREGDSSTMKNVNMLPKKRNGMLIRQKAWTQRGEYWKISIRHIKTTGLEADYLR